MSLQALGLTRELTEEIRWRPLPGFPLIHDGLTGRANPSSQCVLRQAHPPTQTAEVIIVVIRNGR
jgi:hypothetical protein